MRETNIQGKKIGGNNPCLIIAEAGVNHNGEERLARKLVDAAEKAGADAVKFQTYRPQGVTTDVKEERMLEGLSLEYGDFKKLKHYCDKKKWYSSPHPTASTP